MESSSNDLQELEFVKNMTDIDLLSEWGSGQVLEDTTNSEVSSGNPVIGDSHQQGQIALSGDGSLMNDGQGQIQMILGDDGHNESFPYDPSTSEPVMETLGADIVFENVGNEVSIQSDSPGLMRQQQLKPVVTVQQTYAKSSPIKTTTIKPKVTTLANTNKIMKPVSGKPQPIVIPIGNSQAAGASLAQFITQIRPPAMPGGSNLTANNRMTSQQQLPTRVIPIRAITIPPASKKPQTIAPAPSNSISTSQASNVKFIMTQTGQQLLISSPLKSDQLTIGTSNTKYITASSAGTLTTASGQQVFMLSPVKSGGPQKLVQVRPKPEPQPIRVQTSSGNASTGQIINAKQFGGAGDGKPMQIKVVSVPSSSSFSGGKTINVSGLSTSKAGNLRPIAPSPVAKAMSSQALATSISNAIASGQKLITIPSSAIRGNLIQATSVGNLSNLTTPSGSILTSGTGGAQVIMLPANLLQGSQAQVNVSYLE